MKLFVLLPVLGTVNNSCDMKMVWFDFDEKKFYALILTECSVLCAASPLSLCDE